MANDCSDTVLRLQLTSNENASRDKKMKAKTLVADAKLFASEGELYKSLDCFKKAYNLLPTEKIMNRIKRIEDAIKENEEDDEDFGFIELDNGLVIFKQLVERLYPHQIDGVKWMYNLYKAKKKGGILADDMGLGKTIQIIAFISAMFDMKLIKNILLVLPLSVIPNWIQEFKTWAPGIRVECFHGPASKRKGALHHCMMKRSVCITTYGLIVTQWQSLGTTPDGREFTWDYIILDEGHRIKNPSKTTKRLHSIPSRNRLILTGTPVQNKVRDMWALMDWVTQGSLLGTQRTFKSNYELPIERARQRDASAAEIQLGNHMSESLRTLTEPYILRRTKSGLMMENKENMPNPSAGIADKGQDHSVISKQPTFPKLSSKTDFVVWVYLSEIQEKIYRDFIQLDSVKALLSTHRSPLVYLTVLKKICDHPRLLSTKACLELGLELNNDSIGDDMDSSKIEECAANRIDNISDDTLIEESGKLQFLIQLLQRLREEGHRTLVFSMSRKMLNIIQRILMNKKFKIMRLDGLVTKLNERDRRVKKFQEDPSYNIFLLTTQVGGVGLTLTAADRVVIYDPSWNPASDAQSVDRIYRIGQKKSVVVYRLITCGSVEEKIYRRQVFKNSVIQQSTGENKDPYRYFTRQDLKELFVLDDVRSSATQLQLEELHGHQRNFDAKLEEHFAYMHSLKMFGISDHDLMFSQKPDDFNYEEEMSKAEYSGKVAEAQNQLQLESVRFTGLEETEQRWGAFTENVRPKDPNQAVIDNEPVYPIDGLSDNFEALKFSDHSDSASSSLLIKSLNSPHNSPTSSKYEHSNSTTSSLLVKSLNSPHNSPTSSKYEPRARLPSISDDDDDIILAVDSPVVSIRKETNGALSHQANVSSQDHESAHAENSFEERELDNLILAVESPLLARTNGSHTDHNDFTHDDIPSEIQDSILSDEENDDDDDKDYDDDDETWKSAFAANSSSTALLNQALNLSAEDSPLVASGVRRRRVIDSDESEDEHLIDIINPRRPPSSLSTTSIEDGRSTQNPDGSVRRSLNADHFNERFSTDGSEMDPSLSDIESGDDVDEDTVEYDQHSGINFQLSDASVDEF